MHNAKTLLFQFFISDVLFDEVMMVFFLDSLKAILYSFSLLIMI